MVWNSVTIVLPLSECDLVLCIGCVLRAAKKRRRAPDNPNPVNLTSNKEEKQELASSEGVTDLAPNKGVKVSNPAV